VEVCVIQLNILKSGSYDLPVHDIKDTMRKSVPSTM
jgi:hypothetical protein